MSFVPVNTSNSDAANWNQVNALATDVYNDQKVRVIKDDDGVRRVILDKDGLRTSPSGVDVTTATNSQLSFNSNQVALKVVQSGTLNLDIVHTSNTVAAGTQSKVLTHSLGYKPAVLAYATLPDVNSGSDQLIQLPYVSFWTSGAFQGEFAGSTYFAISNTTVTFYVVHQVGTDYTPLVPAWNVKYYLLQESAA